jgi:hypothetical protein
MVSKEEELRGRIGNETIKSIKYYEEEKVVILDFGSGKILKISSDSKLKIEIERIV